MKRKNKKLTGLQVKDFSHLNRRERKQTLREMEKVIHILSKEYERLSLNAL